MTTEITELAQSHELLIANGQQTADLLRHLADNEIDSDYFSVVSECESYGKETDAELSITEFALRASVYVDALVEALEKAQAKADVYDMLMYDYGLREKGVGLADLVDWQANRIAELESIVVKIVDCDYEAVQHMSGGSTDYCHGFVDGTQNAIGAITAAGIKVEAE